LQQSIALFNNHGTDSLFLRILVSWGRITTFVSILEGCRGNWTVQTLIEAGQVMIASEDWDFVERLLDLSTTMDLVSNAGTNSREKFNEVFQALKDNESGGQNIYQQYVQSGYEDIVFNRGEAWSVVESKEIEECFDTDNHERLF
jgi:hypothetical protein